MMNIFKLIFLFILSLNVFAASGDKEDLLSAWENMQKTNPEVQSFEKIENNKYKIKFKTLPYEGDLIVLAYDIEEIGYTIGAESPINRMGYIEIELPDASEDLTQKYTRTYYKWAENNSLYFNSETNKWITSKEYTSNFSDYDLQKYIFFVMFLEYFNYFLFFVILYFVISQIMNNKKVKKSLALQQKAIEQGATLHRETNSILREILQQSKMSSK